MKSWMVWILVVVAILFVYHFWISDNTKASALP